jgi:serine/threonine protein phosphatase PrpC
LLRSYGEVGASASVDSALGGWPQSFPITIETHHLTESAGTFFLATDGVPAGTSLDDLRTIVLDANQSLDERIDALTKHILSGTAPDNFTCALIGLQ